MKNNNGEPSSAPQPDRWYTLKLGSSFKGNPSTKFCTLRYEFKPASIDKSQLGSLHKNKDNRISVDFHNNQPGKPKVSFEGSSEDYKDNDGVLFFDGETFRLERLHRAVKRLRHVRLPGESASAANQTTLPPAGTGTESYSPPLAKVAKPQILNKPVAHPVPVEVEKIDIGERESPGPKAPKKSNTFQSVSQTLSSVSPDQKSFELDLEENLDILGDDDETPNKGIPRDNSVLGFDMNISHRNDSDEEIADVDVSDDANEGPNAAEALRAQVNAESGQQQETSSSSSSTGSDSSGSGSGSDSSSSGSGSGTEDSASSAGDIDI